MHVRTATERDVPAVMNVLDGALLAVTPDAVREGTALVAVDEGRVLGALVLAGEEIEAVAVRRSRRDQGVGTALVEAAAARRERLVAGFDPDVRAFYESLGFQIRDAAAPDRLRGVRAAGDEQAARDR
ncbi:MAG: GNAT family N-acetyltransferase [Haloarculaceae archaeon]